MKYSNQCGEDYENQVKRYEELKAIKTWTKQEHEATIKKMRLLDETSLSLPPYYSDRCCNSFQDNIYGLISITPIFEKFINTEEFQRLHSIKQLGVAHMVYPGAVHSRFEHSLGVYWLANAAVEKLKIHQMELGIDHFDVLTVKLAGLLHDVGHGPFSHLFEEEFLPRVHSGLAWSHENMSVVMIDHMVEEHHIDIDAETIKRVKEMILAGSKFALPSSSEKRFLYDIVANGRNGIDINKFDYIVRDIRACGLAGNVQFQGLLETMRVLGDEICYSTEDYMAIHNLFATRADLHRTVYSHPKVKAIELMVVDALVKANDYLKIASHIEQPSRYWKLSDTILNNIETAPNPELKESRDLILRLRRGNFYQLCNEYAVPRDKIEHFKDVTAHDIVCSQKSGSEELNEEDVAVSNVRTDLTSGRHNPLESIHFFQDHSNDTKVALSDYQITHFLPIPSQEIIVRVYSRKALLVRTISEAFENFMLKTYGVEVKSRPNPLLQ